ncbi:MAG: cation transporter [bacterium]
MKKEICRWIKLVLPISLLFSVSFSAGALGSEKRRRDIKTATLSVEGMTCGGCVTRVTNALENLPGVRSAEVSLETESAKVRYDPNKVDIDSMIKAVKDAGYTAECQPGEKAVLKGVIVDGLTGEPIPKAKVSWIFKHYDEQKEEYVEDYKFETQTDEKGEYAFTEIPEEKIGQECNFGFLVESKDYLQPKGLLNFRATFEDTTEVMNFGLLRKDKSKIIRGRVFDPVTEKPIEGAAVKILVKNPVDEEIVKTFQSKSKADGTFSVEVPAKDTKEGEYYTLLEVEKQGYDYIVYDTHSARTCGDIKERMSNFAITECEYQLSAADNLITVKGTAYEAEGEPLKGEVIDFSGICLTKLCAKGCCGDFNVFDVEFSRQLKTDEEGKFSFRTTAKYLFGLKYGLRVAFDGYEKTYRAIFEKGENRKSREIESDEGDLLELEFSVEAGPERR